MTTKTLLPTTNSLSGSDNSTVSTQNHHQQTIQPPTSREEMLSAQVQSLQEQIQTMALLNRSTPGISHAISQPSIHNDMLYGGPQSMYHPQLPPTIPSYGYPSPQQQTQMYEQSNYAMPHQIQSQIQQNSYYPPPPPSMRYGTPQHHIPNPGMSYSMYEQSLIQQQQQQTISPNIYGLTQQTSFDDYGQQTTIPNANNTFYLHQANASNSRLDPALELNRNLTNWGLTYRSTTKTPRKTWADFKSEHDLRNSNDNDESNVQFYSSKQEYENNLQPRKISKDFDDIKPTKEQLEKSLMKKSPTSPITNGSTGFEIKNIGNKVIEDVTPEMRAKRDALYANLMKRKEQIADKVEEIEAKNMEKRQKEIEKQELAEQRKIEKEIRRQKLLEEYKKKKLEKEFPELQTSSPTMSARSTTSLQRGHSQPPFVSMAKSQSNMTEVLTRSTPRPSRAKSNVGDENSTPRVLVPSTAEPTLKLYAKHVPKSNRSLILNALQYSIFPGAVSNDQRNKVQEALAHSDSKHFLLLFRDQKCQYRGLYTWDQQSDTAHRIHGLGPKIVKDEMMSMMFKYDSGSKHFNPIPAKHLSPTIDGFTIQEQLWMKPKIPHSGGR
uniref:CKK domain-containing protein n=1 Tax=Panagrolaimus sp. JU765 TaxID=591449 RepID=A0AC34PYP1_9BILA